MFERSTYDQPHLYQHIKGVAHQSLWLNDSHPFTRIFSVLLVDSVEGAFFCKHTEDDGFGHLCHIMIACRGCRMAGARGLADGDKEQAAVTVGFTEFLWNVFVHGSGQYHNYWYSFLHKEMQHVALDG